MNSHRRIRSTQPTLHRFVVAVTSLTLSTALFAGGNQSLADSGSVSDTDASVDNIVSVEDRIQRAASDFCLDDARETANYLLTQGTPDDVELMEAVIDMLDTGEWQISADVHRPIVPAPGSGDAALEDAMWLIGTTCRWKTPVADLNGDYDVELEVTLTPDGQESVHRRLP